MNLKKSVFSYLMWFLYSVAVCIGLLGIAGLLAERAGYPAAAGFGVAGLWMLLCGLAVFFLHRLGGRPVESGSRGAMAALVIESLFAVLLFVVGITLRVRGMADGGEEAAYFETAEVAEGQSIPSVVHSAVYLYLQLLHVLCVIFGNRFTAALWLQIALQMIGGLFLYLAVRRMSGTLPALTALGFLMAGPFMVEESLLLSPRVLFFALSAVLLFLCSLCLGGRKRPAACLGIGALTGALCYLDIMGVVVLLLFLAGILLPAKEDNRSPGGRLAGGLLCLLGCACGFLLLIGADAAVSAGEWGNILAAWWKLYQPSSFAIPVSLNTQSVPVEGLLLVLLLSVNVFGYWCERGTERQSVWILSVVVLFLLQCFGMLTEEMNGNFQLYLLFTILAGTGVGSVLAGRQEETETGTDAAEPEKIPEPEKTFGPGEPSEPEKMPEPETPPGPVLLDNPLPLPRQHVRKVLDYDIEVADDDDFDI